jgi:hypothetical protein
LRGFDRKIVSYETLVLLHELWLLNLVSINLSAQGRDVPNTKFLGSMQKAK